MPVRGAAHSGLSQAAAAATLIAAMTALPPGLPDAA